MVSQQFKKQDRILKRKEYVELSDKGKKVHNRHFVLIYSENSKEKSRLGITVTKKVGKAVQRNKIKRYCREFFRLNRSALPENRDINIVAKKQSIYLDSTKTFQTLENLFKKID